MTTYYEDDATAVTTQFERRLLLGCPSFPRVNALLKRLKAEVLTDPTSPAVARVIVIMGTAGEPGAPFVALFKASHLATRFRSKRNQLELDTALAPYYGNVIPGLEEMRGSAIDGSLVDYWLRWFRTDSGIYRPRVVAAMTIGACLEEFRRAA